MTTLNLVGYLSKIFFWIFYGKRTYWGINSQIVGKNSSIKFWEWLLIPTATRLSKSKSHDETPHNRPAMQMILKIKREVAQRSKFKFKTKPVNNCRVLMKNLCKTNSSPTTVIKLFNQHFNNFVYFHTKWRSQKWWRTKGWIIHTFFLRNWFIRNWG